MTDTAHFRQELCDWRSKFSSSHSPCRHCCERQCHIWLAFPIQKKSSVNYFLQYNLRDCDYFFELRAIAARPYRYRYSVASRKFNCRTFGLYLIPPAKKNILSINSRIPVIVNKIFIIIQKFYGIFVGYLVSSVHQCRSLFFSSGLTKKNISVFSHHSRKNLIIRV